MTEDFTISVWVNPLQFLDVDEPWASLRGNPPTHESILQFLCTPGVDPSIDAVVARYKEISVENPRLFAAPAERRLLDRMIWPLRQAKACFCIGSYIGTISLCGLVSEMAAILAFDVSDIAINQKPLDENAQKNLFGSTFERLGQDRRVKVLRAYNIISSELSEHFETVRLKRRTYLHIWSGNDSQLQFDAIACFRAAVAIVIDTLGLSVDMGKIILSPSIHAYLAKHNIGPTAVAPNTAEESPSEAS